MEEVRGLGGTWGDVGELEKEEEQGWDRLWM